MTDSFRAWLAALEGRLTQDEPIRLVPRETAAVAVTLVEGPGLGDVLLIKRAERAGDPWSGDVAFPGGRVEPGDLSFRDTAAREAREEVGAELGSAARFLGYMGPFRTGRRKVGVVPAVFEAPERFEVGSSAEVSSHLWVPLSELLERRGLSTHAKEGGAPGSFPSLEVRGYTVWGLTERILSSLLEPTADRGPTTSRRSP